MKPAFKTILLAGLLAALTAVAQAQPGPGPGPGAGGPGPSGDTRARMHERMDRHIADIKAKLKLTPDQEDLWTNYVTAMKPSADARWPDRASLEKLTTPDRLDKIRDLRKQRDAEMDKREAATRAFYAKLTPEQKKIFDTSTGPHYRNRGMWGPRAQ